MYSVWARDTVRICILTELVRRWLGVESISVLRVLVFSAHWLMSRVQINRYEKNQFSITQVSISLFYLRSLKNVNKLQSSVIVHRVRTIKQTLEQASRRWSYLLLKLEYSASTSEAFVKICKRWSPVIDYSIICKPNLDKRLFRYCSTLVLELWCEVLFNTLFIIVIVHHYQHVIARYWDI